MPSVRTRCRSQKKEHSAETDKENAPGPSVARGVGAAAAAAAAEAALTPRLAAAGARPGEAAASPRTEPRDTTRRLSGQQQTDALNGQRAALSLLLSDVARQPEARREMRRHVAEIMAEIAPDGDLGGGRPPPSVPQLRLLLEDRLGMRRGSLLSSKEMLADCLEEAVGSQVGALSLEARGSGGEGEAAAAARVVRPSRTVQEEAQHYAQAAAGAIPQAAEGGGSAGELVDLARPRFRQVAVYGALTEALLRACGRAAKLDAPVLARLGTLLVALLSPGGLYDKEAVRLELRRAQLPALLSRAVGLTPHGGVELLITAASLMQGK